MKPSEILSSQFFFHGELHGPVIDAYIIHGMKITFNQLKRIINEEIQRLTEMPRKQKREITRPDDARWFELEREGYRAIVQYLDDAVEVVYKDRMRKDVDADYRQQAREEYEYFTDALEEFEQDVFYACDSGDTSLIDEYEVIDIQGTPKRSQ